MRQAGVILETQGLLGLHERRQGDDTDPRQERFRFGPVAVHKHPPLVREQFAADVPHEGVRAAHGTIQEKARSKLNLA